MIKSRDDKINNINYIQFKDKPLNFLFFITKGQQGRIIRVLITIIISESIWGGVMVYLGKITDAISSGSNLSVVYYWAFMLVGAFVVSFIFWRISGFLGSRATTELEKKSFNIVFRYLIKHSHSYFSDRLVGKLASKVSNIARSVESIFPMLFWDFARIITKSSIFIAIAFAIYGCGFRSY
jgi:ATP-binding cassette subfamily B protein